MFWLGFTQENAVPANVSSWRNPASPAAARRTTVFVIPVGTAGGSQLRAVPPSFSANCLSAIRASRSILVFPFFPVKATKRSTWAARSGEQELTFESANPLLTLQPETLQLLHGHHPSRRSHHADWVRQGKSVLASSRLARTGFPVRSFAFPVFGESPQRKTGRPSDALPDKPEN
jgi:hypothetical protein